MKFRKIIAGALCAALGITLCGCGEAKIPEITEDNTPLAAASYKTVKLDANGGLEITRKETGNVPMGEDGTWTIFVYMSGSTLETGSSSGSRDIEEMCRSTAGENVRFVVQTGGSKTWQYDKISSEKLERHVISNGERKTVAQLPLSSMGDAATLRNFLKWGVENYPAAKMGLVLWGHGKGTLGGVCKDDLFDDDYLELGEMNSALSEVSALMTDKFEFVGFDACYMATLETADILASYARYMIGSEEFEPLNGWNYTALGDLLEKEPNADWSKIAQTVCDSFLTDSEKSEHASRVTLSVIDLSSIDSLLAAFNDYTREICAKLTDRTQLREFNKALEAAEHFGNETAYYGYSNRLDLGDFANAGREITDKADAVSKALDSAVIQKSAGGGHQNAAGLTLYYPFAANGTAELREIGRLAPCPYYMEFIDKMLLSSSPAANTESIGKGAAAALCVGDIGGESGPLDGYWRDLGEQGGGGISAAVKTVGELSVGRDGKYKISISPETLRYASSVGIRVSLKRDDGDYSALGTMLCPSADWETGVFSGSFNGQWIMLPNRDPVSLKPRERTDGGVFYVSNMRLEKEIVAVSFFADTVGRVYIEGYWKYGEDGKYSLEKFEDNATLVAARDIHPCGGAATDNMLGEKVIFDGEAKAVYEKLRDGEYCCVLEITDVYGDTLKSEIVDLSISGGTLSFNT